MRVQVRGCGKARQGKGREGKGREGKGREGRVCRSPGFTFALLVVVLCRPPPPHPSLSPCGTADVGFIC